MLKHKIQRVKRLLSQLSPRSNGGFTIVEVLIALAIISVVLVGISTAMSASLRLNSVQTQRTRAQDITRDVISRYLKNVDFATINPFDGDVNPASVYPPNAPHQVLLYNYNASPPGAGLTSASLTGLGDDLARLPKARLVVNMTPIKKDGTTYFETKFNAVVRITWGEGNNHFVETPTVLSFGDLSRAVREDFQQPAVPTAAPSVSPSSSPSGAASPSSSPSSSASASLPACLPGGSPCSGNNACKTECCSGGGTNSGGWKCDGAAATPTPPPSATPTPACEPPGTVVTNANQCCSGNAPNDKGTKTCT